MGEIDDRVTELGLTLPAMAAVPSGVVLPFSWVRVRGNRAYVSGHGPLNADGTLREPLGKVPSQVSLDQAQDAATAAALAVIGSLQRELGSLDRVTAWLTVNGCVNADAGYAQTTMVLNPASELIVRIFGSDVGEHARTALGYAALPFNVPVIIAAELEIG